MAIYYHFTQGSSEKVYGTGGREMKLDANVCQDRKSIHFDEPKMVEGDLKCPMPDTPFSSKEVIKSTNWKFVQYGWHGEFWACYPRGLEDLIPALLDAGYSVSAHPKAVHACDGLEEFRGTITIDEEENESITFDAGFDDAKGTMSRTRAENMADMLRYRSVEEFVEDFDVNVIRDEEAKEKAEQEDDGKVNKLAGSSSASRRFS